jgi:membrane protein DedA with SNARE-associated domain/rhodanese-related sulfurtransferase
MTTLLQLTYCRLLFAVLAQQLGLPVPSVVFLMAAGALSAHGAMHPVVALFLGVAGCLVGDGVWYWMGRKWGPKALGLLCRFTADPRSCSRNAQAKFRRHGLRLLCVAKFVPGLDALMPPLAGAERVLLTRFLAVDAVGSLLWSGSYLGLGRIFSNQLNVAIRWAQNCGTALGIAIILPLVLYAAWRGFILVRMILELRQRRITPPMLASKLEADNKIAVLDLTNFEGADATQSFRAIPGAFVLDPSHLRKSPQIAVPDDLEIIIYSSSGSDTVAARAAVSLKRIGVANVWVLEGGLEAWCGHGFPVSKTPELPHVVAERYGVKLPRTDGIEHRTELPN